jgi:hypothetical protein
MLFDAAELRRKGRISDRISNSAHPRFEET